MSFILAFDYGTHSIGVAVGNSITKSASPLKAVKANYGEYNIEHFAPFFKEWCPSAIVVGYPLNMDGTTQELLELATKFGHDLEQRFKVKLHFQDERLTSTQARSYIFDKGGYKALKKDKIDCVSAAIILEAFFEQEYAQ